MLDEIPPARIRFVPNRLHWDKRGLGKNDPETLSKVYRISFYNISLKQSPGIAFITALRCFQTESVSTKYQRRVKCHRPQPTLLLTLSYSEDPSIS